MSEVTSTVRGLVGLNEHWKNTNNAQITSPRSRRATRNNKEWRAHTRTNKSNNKNKIKKEQQKKKKKTLKFSICLKQKTVAPYDTRINLQFFFYCLHNLNTQVLMQT